MNRPWDSGLQNERTRLAWQRTALSGLGCSLVLARLLTPLHPAVAVTLALGALGSTVAFGWFTSRRYRRTHVALYRRETVGDGRPHLLLSVLVTLTALGAVAYAMLVARA